VIGAVFSGRYTLTGLLADGPIFSLYSAKDRQTAREVSLRLIKSPFDREQAFKDALIEAIAQGAALQSPHVERLHELVEGDHAFIVGELTRAPTLADRIRKLAPFTSPVAVSAAIGVARGLDVFHKHGQVHGDVNGENVAMMADGDTRLQLGGIWKAYSASPTAGAVVLPAMAPYLAPEVSSGGMPGPASDVYSVGVLLYELLTGRKPYLADSAIATAMRHVSQNTPRVRDANNAVPIVLDEIVYKAMAKEPQNRYANAADLLLDLRQVQDAMRFGKNLTWPLRAREPVANATSPSVAPRMSAVRTDSETASQAKKRSKERDVPVWMLVIFAALVGVVGCLLAFYMYFNLNRPKMVLVPELTGLTKQEAKDTLEKLHLRYEEGQSVTNEKIEADHVVAENPEKGTKLVESSPVTVTLSEGSSMVQVPNLKNLTVDKASENLLDLGLVEDTVTDKIHDPNIPDGEVVKQSPEAGKSVARNSTVHLTLSSGPAPPKPDDSSDQTYTYVLHITLTGIEGTVDVRIDVDDAQGPRSGVFEAEKEGGETFDASINAYGSKATFKIYYDDNLVKTIVRTPKSDSQ